MANIKLEGLNGIMLIPGVSANVPEINYEGIQKGEYKEVEKMSCQIATCTYDRNGNRLNHDDATFIYINA